MSVWAETIQGVTDLSRPAAALDAHDRIEATAHRIATDWGHHGHSTVTEMIAEFYTDLAVLPTHYTPQQRADAIADAADTTAGELTTLLDDYTDQEAGRPPITEYGWTLHNEDRHDVVTAALATLVDEHLTWWLTEQLNNFITDREHEDFD